MVIPPTHLRAPFGSGSDLGQEESGLTLASGQQIKFLPMQAEHIPGVLAIEKASFPSPWSEESFAYEVAENHFAYYLVAVADEEVVAYGGMWIILDEAHITNIAVHPEFRRLQLGRELLSRLMLWAAFIGADSMTLEVRTSNHPAQQLYESLGFVARGLRKGYYSDTKEDAIIMWRENLGALGKDDTGDQ